MSKGFKRVIDELADWCWEQTEPQVFDERDMVNASKIFQHVFGNLHFDFCHRHGFSLDESSKRAEKFGSQLRQLIIDGTGIDLHEVHNNPLDAEVIEDEHSSN